MDLNAVRTFVAVAETGQFQLAAIDLARTQQAVSKRIATLEEELGVRLFVRTARGAQLTIDGQAFLPHARELLRAEERAAASVQPGRRALRVDVIGRQLCPAGLLRDFHRGRPEIELDIVTLFDADQAIAALQAGTIDATFRAMTMPGLDLPGDIQAVPVLDEPLHLCVSSAHEFATAGSVTPTQLAGHRVWMPGNVPGTEWSAYYDEFAAAFGVTIDTVGPDFGIEALLDAVADSAVLATIVSERTPLVWPASHDLRRVPLHDPTPVYPHSLLWRADNSHPGLRALRDHLASLRTDAPDRVEAQIWRPGWSQGLRAARHRGAGQE